MRRHFENIYRLFNRKKIVLGKESRSTFEIRFFRFYSSENSIGRNFANERKKKNFRPSSPGLLGNFIYRKCNNGYTVKREHETLPVRWD